MTLNVLSSDLLIADNMIPLYYKRRDEIARLEAKNPKIAGKYIDVEKLDEPLKTKYKKLNAIIGRLLEKNEAKWGGKIAIDKEEFKELSAAISGVPTNGMEPGGSSANTLTTLIRLMGHKNIHVDFLGVAGGQGGMYSNMIREDLNKTHIHLVHDTPPADGAIPESAVSFVFTEPGGKRTIATYPGNARKILEPTMITDDLIARNDVVFVQGSLWEKFERKLPDTILDKRWLQNKEIWLALPTHAKFSDQMTPDNYRFLIPSADVVLGNSDELMRIYETSKDFDKRTEGMTKEQIGKVEEADLNKAIVMLQLDLGKRDYINTIRAEKFLPPLRPDTKAFISNGEHGAIAVTAKDRVDVPAVPLATDRESYLLGAGDTTYAGFLAGHMAGLPIKESTELAMELAAAKIKYNSARIPDPGPTQEMERGSHRARRLWQKVEAGLKQQETGKSDRSMSG